MKFIFVLLVLTSCINKAEMDTKFAYDEYVQVNSGFYRGSKGKVTDIQCRDSAGGKCTKISYTVLYDSVTSQYHDESQLDKAEKIETEKQLSTTPRCFKKKRRTDYGSDEMYVEVECDTKPIEEPTSDSSL
jgi:hypothetical protein